MMDPHLSDLFSSENTTAFDSQILPYYPLLYYRPYCCNDLWQLTQGYVGDRDLYSSMLAI